MNETHLTDRIPDVAAGRVAWTAGEAAHLAACAACRAELRLMSAVQDRAAHRVEVDADRLARTVLDRLRTEPVVMPPRARSRWLRPAVLLAAAASVALALVLRTPPATDDRAVVPAREPTMLPELDELLESELEVILAMFPDEPPTDPRAQSRLGDLTDAELELLLEELDG